MFREGAGTGVLFELLFFGSKQLANEQELEKWREGMEYVRGCLTERPHVK